jgi:hypothetical protein
MSVSVAKNRFINVSLVDKYRHFMGSALNIVELGKHLTLAAETAQLMRQTDAVREYGLILSNLPVKEYQLIGQYYLGWYACCNGNDVSASLFENIFDRSKTFKAKSLITIGALAGAKGDLETELWYQNEALKYSDLATSIRILRGMAVVKGKEGFHKSAVRTIESVLPVLPFARPQVYYDTLNSYAVELGEVGRIQEAQNVCRITLASPYLIAYPEWRETGQDLALRGYKSRSSIQVKKIPGNLLYLPERSPVADRPKPGYLAPVVDYLKWKKKMGKKPNGNGEELPEDMTVQQMAMKIIELITKNKDDEDKLRDLLEQAMKIYSKK